MNKRILKKKIQHENSTYSQLLRQARTRGSKTLCRRDRAIRRLSRQTRREQLGKIAICEETLSRLAAYEPKSEEERKEVQHWQEKFGGSQGDPADHVGLHGEGERQMTNSEETGTKRVRDLVRSYATPCVAFSARLDEVHALGNQPRWAGISGANTDDLETAVLAFNQGKLDGIALTFSSGCMGFLLRDAMTLVMIGTAPADVMAQAAARAPGATKVIL